MKSFALMLLACLPLAAQTPPNTLVYLDQVQGRVKSTTPMLILMTNGKPSSVQLDSSLVLNLATNPPTLSAASARFPTPNIETFSFPIITTATTITLAFAPILNTLACYRNGMRLSSGFDFTQSATVLTFASSSAPQAGDLFTCDYQH